MLGSSFDDARPVELFDVVPAVHSLNYVDDLVATLRRARGLLAPGGVLAVLHAPSGPLNRLVRLVAAGPRQGFSDEVAVQLRGMGGKAEVVRIDNRLDLTPAGNPETDRRLLEFTVQAQVVPRAAEGRPRGAGRAVAARPGAGRTASGGRAGAAR